MIYGMRNFEILKLFNTKMIKKISIIITFLLINDIANGQIIIPSLDTLVNSEMLDMPSLTLNQEQLTKEDKKSEYKEKRKKRKVFYGTKTKKIVLRKKKKDIFTFEIFHIPKVHQDPEKYIDMVYYYDYKDRDIKTISRRRYKRELGPPLHGAYKFYLGNNLARSGSFYFGSKDSRWEIYGKNMLLIDKLKYYKGFPKESKITYWDNESKEIKDVIPIHYGFIEGVYLSYYTSGNIKERGQYKHGKKIKTWWEYYDKPHRSHKKQTIYPENPSSEEKPYIKNQWNEDGKKIVKTNKKTS